MNAVSDLGSRVGNVLRVQAAIDGLPRFATVIGSERARGRDGDEDAVRVLRVENDRVQAHAAGAGLPPRASAMTTQAREFLPGFAAVSRAEQSGVLNTGVDGVRVAERGFEMPDTLEFPGMLRAVVPLMRRERCSGRIVNELVAFAFGHAAWPGRFARRRTRLEPGFSTVVGALNDLTEPAAGLRGVDAIGVDGRALQVVHLPSGKMGTVDFPVLALAVRGENECALASANQYANRAHEFHPFMRVMNQLMLKSAEFRRPRQCQSPIDWYNAAQKSRKTSGPLGEGHMHCVSKMPVRFSAGSARQDVPRPPSQPVRRVTMDTPNPQPRDSK